MINHRFLALAMLAMSMGVDAPWSEVSKRRLSKEEIEKLREQAAINAGKRKLNRGAQLFVIDGFEVIALNKENAERKVRNIKQEILKLNEEDGI